MSLYAKMHAVMCESESLEKSMEVGKGYNAYKAISEAEVLNNIKPLLKKHNLIIFPTSGSIQEINSQIEYEKDGVVTTKARNITQVVVNFKIVDTETGESDNIIGFGNGADTQDKGSGKAFTYAYKTALSKTFMLFSGDDSDNDHSDDIGEPLKQTTLPTKSKLPQKPASTVNKPTQEPSKPKVERDASMPTTNAPASQSPAKPAVAEAPKKPIEPVAPAIKENPFKGKTEEVEKFFCEDCTLEIKAVKSTKGVSYTPKQIFEGSKAKYGRHLCNDCSVKARDAEKHV